MNDTVYPRYGELVLGKTGAGHLYVRRPFHFELAPEVRDVIYPGLTTDLASTGVLYTFIKPWGPWTEPSVVHDRDYRYGDIPRKEADLRFYRGCRAQGVGVVKANAMYYTVRAFAGGVWNDYREREK